MSVQVIAVDGPAGAGKGSLAFMLSQKLGGWHLLDSGALYRCVAWKALQAQIDMSDSKALIELVGDLGEVKFVTDGQEPMPRIWVNAVDVHDELREESVGVAASKFAEHPQVRKALLNLQRSFLRPPGLVADGRDMGTRVFADSPLKIFLTAQPEVRAQRRYRQLYGAIDLKNPEVQAMIGGLQRRIAQRDLQDRQRKHDPLRPASDAVVIDSTDLSLEQVSDQVLQLAQDRGLLD